MVHPLSRDRAAVSNWIVLLVLVIVVAGVLGVYYAYFTPKAGAPTLYVQLGDKITVDYIGTFQTSGRVFDTSNTSVAKDNATYPKAFSFSWRSSWTPLSFTVGDRSVIPGFDEGVRGLPQGGADTIAVTQDQGYGPADPTKVFVHKLLESVPEKTVYDPTSFFAYFKTNPVSGSTVADPVWGWPDYVGVAGSVVTVTASPALNQRIRPYDAWTATVVSIDSFADNGTGVIQVQHDLTPSMVDAVGGTVSGTQTFYLADVDPAAGTYTLSFNREVVGRTLLFQATIVSITRST